MCESRLFLTAVLYLLALVVTATCTAVPSSKSTTHQTNKMCQPTKLYKSSVPAGGDGVEHFKVIGTGLSADVCISKCCDLRQSQCQFMWVFENTCVAVACEEGGESNCLPRKVTSKDPAMVYVEINHINFDRQLKKVLQLLANRGSSKKGDSPLLGDAGPKEITVNVLSRDTYVYLHGNKSTDDKGIVSYAWKLFSDHFVQPILENVDQPVLSVHGLISGIYKFSLTVKDIEGQTANTTVIVHVIKGANNTTEKVVTTEQITEALDASHSPTQSPDQDTETSHLTLYMTSPPGDGGSVLNATADLEGVDTDRLDEYYIKRRNMIRIVIPVLVSLALVLIVSALIAALAACCCERNRRKMKRYYKYRRIPETIEKL